MPTSPLPTYLARFLKCIECLGRFGEPQLQLIIIMETCAGGESVAMAVGVALAVAVAVDFFIGFNATIWTH